jgi:hypothetical protein
VGVTVAGLDPCLAEAIRRYEGALIRLHDILANLGDDALRSPGKGAWSVSQCVDHVVVAGSLMVARLEEAIARARQLTRTARDPRPAKFGWFDRFFVYAVSGGKDGKPPRVKVAHRPVFDPGPGRPVTLLAAEFIALQDRLITTARSAQGLDLADIKVPSVVDDRIKVALGAWFLAIAGHQERHLEQAARTRAAIGR